MPVLTVLHPRLMYFIRQTFNLINQMYLNDLQDVIPTIDIFINSPRETQDWYKTLCTQIQDWGITQPEDQEAVINAIINLLKHKKLVAEIKARPIYIKQEIDQNIAASLASMTLSPSNQQLIEVTNNYFMMDVDDIKSKLSESIQGGGNPNIEVESEMYAKEHLLFIFVRRGVLSAVQTLVAANVDVERKKNNQSVLPELYSILFSQTFTQDHRLEELRNTFEMLLAHGANPDVGGIDWKGDRQNDSFLLISIVRYFNSKYYKDNPNGRWAKLHLQLVELFLQYGAEHKDALAYAKTNNCDKAVIAILEKYHYQRLSVTERQFFRNQRILQTFDGVPCVSHIHDLMIRQGMTTPKLQKLIVDPKIETSANKIKINGKDLTHIIAAQLNKYGITHNASVMQNHRVHIQPVITFLAGSPDAAGVVTAKFTPDFKSPSQPKRILVINFIQRQTEPACRFLTFNGADTQQRNEEIVVREIPGDANYIMGQQDAMAPVVPPENTCFTVFVEVNNSEGAALYLSPNPIQVYKIASIVVNLPESEKQDSLVFITHNAQRLVTLALGRASQLSQQIKDQIIAEVGVDYSFNGLQSRLKVILFSYGINLFYNGGINVLTKNYVGFEDMVIFTEPLLLMHGFTEEQTTSRNSNNPLCGDQFIITLDISEQRVMEFIGKLNTKYGWGTAKRVEMRDDGQVLAVGLNIAVIIDKILPEYSAFIKEEFKRNPLLLKYYQSITNPGNRDLDINFDVIRQKFEQVSEGYGLTYKHNSSACFLPAILLRTFGIEEPLQNGNISDRSRRYVRFACQLNLAISDESATKFVENINRQFPGAALILNPVIEESTYVAANQQRNRMVAVSLDNAVFSGPILELYRAQLVELAEKDPDFLVGLQIQCKTRAKSTSQLVEQLNSDALKMQNINPPLAVAITTFSSILHSKRRADEELKNADWKMKQAFHEAQAALCTKHNEEGLATVKKAKTSVKDAEREIGLRLR